MDMLDPQKMAANPQAMSQIYGSTDPNAYAPGQLDNELARIRTLRGQGALPPGRQPQGMPGQGMNLQSLLQLRDQLYRDFASAPQIRNPQQEMRYQNLQVGLGNLTKMIEQEQNREIAAEERKMKMDLLKQAQEDAQKMKREAHFEKLRRMGNAAKMADYASGKTQAGTFTGAGGTVSVPTVDAKAMPTLGNITKLIGQGKSVEARAKIEDRRGGILNFLMKNPVTDEATGAAKSELAQLGNLYSEIVATEMQKLINQGKTDVATVKNEDKRLGKEQSKYIYGKVPRQYQVPKIDPLGNPVLDPTTNQPAYDIKTYYEEPDLPTILERYKKLGIEPPASLTGQAAPAQGAAPQQGGFFGRLFGGQAAPQQGGQAPAPTQVSSPIPTRGAQINPVRMKEVKTAVTQVKGYNALSSTQKITYLQEMMKKPANQAYKNELSAMISDLRGGK